MSNFGDDAHFIVIRTILSLHPKPLPEAALEACWIVLRRPSHPAYYKHRVDALNWLVEAASEGRYARSDVENLVLDLARNESDPDVRVAAIAWVPWALSRHVREALADALAHESSKIREAALRVVAEANSGAR